MDVWIVLPMFGLFCHVYLVYTNIVYDHSYVPLVLGVCRPEPIIMCRRNLFQICFKFICEWDTGSLE